jgi:hypothetical protein
MSDLSTCDLVRYQGIERRRSHHSSLITLITHHSEEEQVPLSMKTYLMKSRIWQSNILLVFILASSASSFAPAKTSTRSFQDSQPSRSRLLSSTKEIFLVNWDGCVADTVPWRIRAGVDAALKTWPEIPVDDDFSWEDSSNDWLQNKLSALSHVFSSTDEDVFSLTCEYALAARLSLEEQELDNGNSNGRRGKYSRRFHPQVEREEERGPTRSSRPLTVGEVAANWEETIRDTVRMRYHCNYKDPLPILQNHVEDLIETELYQIPAIDPIVCEALSASGGKVFLTVSHSSELEIAESSLEQAKMDYQLVESVQEGIECKSQVALILKSKDMVSKAITNSPVDSTIYVMDSSWHALQKEVLLFGDYIPRQGVGRCFQPDRRLSLCLAKWATNTDPSQHSAATMNPWTRLVNLSEFTELVSARIL